MKSREQKNTEKNLRRKISNWNSKIKKRGGSFRVSLEWCKQFTVCSYCKAKLDISIYSLDHKIPISKGGKDEESNLHLVCNKCNRAKGSLADIEFLALMIFLDTMKPESKWLIYRKLLLGWRAG